MKNILALLTAFMVCGSLLAKPEHEHEDEHDDHNTPTKHEEAEHGHDDSDHAHDESKHDDSEHAEASPAVGPEKGVTEADEKRGFKLSAEAAKNFDLRFLKLEGRGPWTIPASAVVRSGEEADLFRHRDGFFRKIEFKTLRRSGADVVVSSPELQAGDQVVLSGAGFLRIAELAAFGGIDHGHSH